MAMTSNVGILKLAEAGFLPARIGTPLSYWVIDNTEPLSELVNKILDKESPILEKLAPKGHGENKYLEMIWTWWIIRMPRDWWSHFDQYRHAQQHVDDSVTLSSSTMHTLLRRHVVESDFAGECAPGTLGFINLCIDLNQLEKAKRALPEGYLQTRVVAMNYQTLRNILLQRSTHKLEEWQVFCDAVRQEVEHPELLP